MADHQSARDDLRDAVQRMRRPVDERVLEAASDRALRHLASLTAVQRAGVVALHAPAGDDLDPRGLASRLADRGTRILLVEPDGDEIRVMTTGRAHLVRPDDPTAALDEVDVAILPGVAFDLDGGRLGADEDPWEDVVAQLAAAVVRVGLAHTFQLVPRVPRGAHHHVVDAVVTDRGVHHTGARSRPRDA